MDSVDNFVNNSVNNLYFCLVEEMFIYQNIIGRIFRVERRIKKRSVTGQSRSFSG